MKSYKFRAWEKNLKEMIPVHDIDFEKKMINTTTAWRFFDEIELMQYAGIKDKNGNEIYESYLVNDNVGVGFVELLNGAFRVNYGNGRCKWFIDYLTNERRTIEVIGNIYENPELLNK